MRRLTRHLAAIGAALACTLALAAPAAADYQVPVRGGVVTIPAFDPADHTSSDACQVALNAALNALSVQLGNIPFPPPGEPGYHEWAIAISAAMDALNALRPVCLALVPGVAPTRPAPAGGCLAGYASPFNRAACLVDLTVSSSRNPIPSGYRALTPEELKLIDDNLAAIRAAKAKIAQWGKGVCDEGGKQDRKVATRGAKQAQRGTPAQQVGAARALKVLRYLDLYCRGVAPFTFTVNEMERVYGELKKRGYIRKGQTVPAPRGVQARRDVAASALRTRRPRRWRGSAPPCATGPPCARRYARSSAPAGARPCWQRASGPSGSPCARSPRPCGRRRRPEPSSRPRWRS